MTYVFAAYSIIFLGIFLLAWSIVSRQKRLERKLEDLKEELRDTGRR